jgi:hypothetical protein
MDTRCRAISYGSAISKFMQGNSKIFEKTVWKKTEAGKK